MARLWPCIIIQLILLYPALALAQAPELPGSADPGRLIDRLRPTQDIRSDQRKTPEELRVEEDIPFAKDGFTLQGVRVQGVTAFDEDYFDAVIEDYVGGQVDVQTLNHLSARITKIYHDNGFFLSRAVVPEQELENGVVRIQIIEGYLNDITIESEDGIFDNDKYNIIRDFKEKLLLQKPLHGPTLERTILLLNDAAGIEAGTLLKNPEGASNAGAIDMVLSIKKAKATKVLSFDNYGSRFVGPNQIRGFYSHPGVFNALDALSLSATITEPIKELQFGSIGYETPLNAHGLSLSLLASYSNSEPGLSLKPLNTQTNSTTISTELSYALKKSRAESLIVSAGAELRNTSSQFLEEELLDDKTRAFYLSTEYNTFDKWGGNNIVTARLSQGLNVMGAEKTGSGKLSRAQGRSDFKTLRIEALRQQYVRDNWAVVNSVSGQWAPHPLLSAQEFGYGGVNYGRAYDPSEITGDQGLATAIEVRYLPENQHTDSHTKFTPFVFYDIGKVWNHDANSPPQSAASGGFGTYWSYDNTLNGSIQMAWPLTKTVDTPIMGAEDGPRILFNLSLNL